MKNNRDWFLLGTFVLALGILLGCIFMHSSRETALQQVDVLKAEVNILTEIIKGEKI